MFSSSKSAWLSHVCVAALVCAGLTGCNTYDDDREAFNDTVVLPPPPPPPPPPPATIDVSGTVSGLSGEITVTANGESTTLSADGSFSFPALITEGGTVEFAIPSDPLGQICSLDGSSVLENVTADPAVTIACEDATLLTARLQDVSSGDPLAEADVMVSTTSDGTTRSEMLSTDAEGAAVFEVPVNGARIVASADPDGFGAQSVVVPAPVAAEELSESLLMIPTDLTATLDNSVGGTFSVDGDTLLEVPANAFVDANGAAVSGDITVAITVIDPSPDVDLMPGDLAEEGSAGEPAPIESYGAVDFAFTDSDGADVQLADGTSATIRIPVAARVASGAPASIPLYFYQPDTGFWVEEGTAALTTLASGNRVYEGTVSHFTTWNADRRFETVTATGCAVDADGEPVADVLIRMEGANYIGRATARTDGTGLFRVFMRQNSSQRVAATGRSQSRTRTVSSGGSDFTFASPEDDNCLVIGPQELGEGSAVSELTWGENPRDLDANFFGVPTNPSADDFQFQVSYRDRDVTVGDTTIFLDVDDTSSFGPEIVTIPAFPYEGTYTYTVDQFSGSGNMQTSPARVALTFDGRLRIYTPPAGEPTRCWAVWRADVDADGAITVSEIGTWEVRDYCTRGVGIYPNTTDASARQAEPPLTKAAAD